MQSIKTSSEGLRHEFKVTLPAENITARTDVRLTEIAKTLHLHGFRPGKVPIRLVYRRYGQAIRAEAIATSIQECTVQILKEHNLRPAMEPQISILSGAEEIGKDVAFTLTLEVLPELPFVDFTTIHLERLKAEVDDQAVEKMLVNLASQRSVSQDLRVGDVVVINVRGIVDGFDIPDIARTDLTLKLGADNFVPGFDMALIGAMLGERRNFTLTWPDGSFAGKEVAFTVEIKELKEIGNVLIDDHLAKSYGVEHLDALREVVYGLLTQRYAAQSRIKLKRDLFDRLAANYIFTVPSNMLNTELNTIWRQVTKTLEKDELNHDDEEIITARYRAVAERRVRLGLLLAEIGRINNITLAHTDIEQALITENEKLPLPLRKKELEYCCRTPEFLDVLKMSIFEEKVVDFILAAAQVTERVVTREELFIEPESPW